MDVDNAASQVRLDKWLWAARFFKTRALAVDAINGGHVHLDGNRVKPARVVQVGDELSIRKGESEFVVVVQAVSGQRGPATVAQQLYEETEQSRQLREQRMEERRLLQPAAGPSKRPDKRGRRQIIRFTGKGG